jgi:hypothetical protein
MMAEAWRDLVRGFDGVDPPLDLFQRVRECEAGLQPTLRNGWRVPRAAGWAAAAVAAAAVVAALALAAHSRRDHPAGPVTASPEKLALLRSSFALGSGWRQYPGASASGFLLPFPVPQPHSTLASSRNLDSIWVARRTVVLIWKSGVVEQVVPVYLGPRPNEPSRTTVSIGGSTAVVRASTPPGTKIGDAHTPPAELRYGSPSSVEMVRGGLDVTLYQYGPGTLPGLIEVARTLPTHAEFARIIDDPRTVITGGTPKQRQVLRSIMRGIDSNDVPKVEIGSPPAPYNAKGRIWLTFRMSGLKNDSQLGIWETWLAAGTFRELSRSRGLPDVHGFGESFADSTPGSQDTYTFPSDASHPTSNIDAETLTATIMRNLARAHLSLVSLRFARPFNLAPIVVARTDDPQAETRGWVPKLNPIGDDGELEGGFFEVVDASGKVVFFIGHATRTQSGVGSTGVGTNIPTG